MLGQILDASLGNASLWFNTRRHRPDAQSVFFWQEPIPTAASSSHGKLTSATSTGGSLARTTAPPSRLPSLPDYGNDSFHSNSSSSQPVGKSLVASQNDKSEKSKVVVVTHRMTDRKVLTTESSVNQLKVTILANLTYSVMCAIQLFPPTERWWRGF